MRLLKKISPCSIPILTIALFFIVINSGHATHNRAGEITYVQTDDLSIRATIVTYTRTSSEAADRDSLTLYWGDGDSTVVQRSNLNGEILPNDVKRNEYTSTHTYPTRGTYKLSVSDPNRIAGILNIDFPNSVNIRFYIETTLTLLEPRFQGRNSSAILLQPPIDLACAGEVYTYNPNAYDIDGDSLSYELITPFAESGIEVPNYDLPDKINPGSDNMINLDPVTGDFTWDAPQSLGEYNITYKISEFRNGTLINVIIRDMQILVRACPDENKAPSIEVVEEICVIAGETAIIDIMATDSDSIEILSMTALGGPFELTDSPASIELGPALANSELSGQIRWQTSCNHVAQEAYQIVVRVSDEISKPMTGLASLKTIRIRVVAPPPTGLIALNENNVVSLSWDKPYGCEDGNTFQGFSVWRKINSSTIVQDTCKGGLDGTPYERVVFLTDEMSNGRYVATDAEIEPGLIYCYRVVPEFAQLTDQGNPYNGVQGIPSEEFCLRSSGENPLITKVSIVTTDENVGMLELVWINPSSNDIDTNILVGPYKLSVSGTNNLNGSGLTEIMQYPYAQGDFAEIDDTSKVLTQLDTKNSGHSFSVSFISGEENGSEFIANSDIASSIFLNAIGTDRQITLNWQENVPWNNYISYIYNIVDGDRVLIDSTSSNSLTIESLQNDIEYCYLVESHGTYNISNIREPLVNFSNTTCSIPMDDVAPCSPEFTISTVCDEVTVLPDQSLENVITWNYSDASCQEASDLASIIVYYAENDEQGFVKLQEIEKGANIFVHALEENISGCYAISAVDVRGNESELSNFICVDNCPTYELPNTFTPNGDNANDIFIPRMNRFIERIDFKVFNRWGEQVFETNDPSINWDGSNMGNSPLSEATYYYTCVVFEKRVSGVEEGEILKGTIQLVR